MITSPDNNKIKEVVKLRDKKRARDTEGLFVAEGLKLVLEALPESVESVFCTPEVYEEVPEIGERFAEKTETVSPGVFSKMSDTDTPQGLLAVIRKRDLPAEDLLDAGKEQPLLLFLEDIRDPGNLGTIVRLSEAAGVTGIIMSKGTADIYNPKTVRSTMGSVYRVSFAYTDDLQGLALQAKKRSIALFAAMPGGEKNCWEQDYKRACGFLIGNEAAGLTKETAGLADDKVLIPMAGKVESLNAAIATSVLCFEAARQRSAGRSAVK